MTEKDDGAERVIQQERETISFKEQSEAVLMGVIVGLVTGLLCFVVAEVLRR